MTYQLRRRGPLFDETSTEDTVLAKLSAESSLDATHVTADTPRIDSYATHVRDDGSNVDKEDKEARRVDASSRKAY